MCFESEKQKYWAIEANEIGVFYDKNWYQTKKMEVIMTKNGEKNTLRITIKKNFIVKFTLSKPRNREM